MSQQSSSQSLSHVPVVPDTSVPLALQQGTMMLKVSAKKEKRVLFRIDPDEGQIFYESRKSGVIPIEAIKEIRSGPESRYYRSQFKLSQAMEDRWITIIYILEGSYKTIHIVSDTTEIFTDWLTTLKKLCVVRQGLMTGLGNIKVRDTVWEKQYWKGADRQGDQRLEFAEVEGLCRRLNVNSSQAELRKIFEEADSQRYGYLDFDAFKRFVKLLKRRPDIETIYNDLGRLDLPTFTKFLHECQKSTADASTIFSRYSPNSEVMSLGAFVSFLFSNDNSPFSELNDPNWQDMTRPMPEYFVSSSHNTYLVGHQLVGVSTVEGYIRALLHSCRSVELDIYDGEDGEPVVYHGKTLTSEVTVRAVCEAIAKYAFVTSPYAIIISAEVHCGVQQQNKIAELMTAVFGDSMIQAPVEGRPPVDQLPSPKDLKGKILLKAKNLYLAAEIAAEQVRKTEEARAATAADESWSSSSSSGTDSSILDNLKSRWRRVKKSQPKNKPLMSFKLASLLVYTVGVKCRGLSATETYAPEHIFSLSESRANRTDPKALVRHTHGHMVRIYPKGTRVNSTNYEPVKYWAVGAQLVAINWQTFDLGYMINQAMFQRNGRCGYVLKPEALRPGGESLLERKIRYTFEVKIVSAQQLPLPKNSSGQEVVEKSVIDPYVEVSLYVPDWTHSSFDEWSEALESGKTQDKKISARTGVVKNNGFNPVWNQDLSLSFDCIGGESMLDLIFVLFAVRDDEEDEKAVASYCVPLGELRQGWRHLPLHDEQLSQFLFSTLFVKTGLREA
ncbi:PLC-like phosphodiesterase [Guyanagaster necrorhizus]|uniref:Phosphoinositide phospholipase C n=1 Tax=Guyanagaster necrorhizus TaxID=856835 RepID=A0A9P7W3H8_9AGAR|nr:PLC-like phosphodiesterase [Guyanagaster necrorhizus MCA 3950]KAG7451424.1 PLC-like phosphodiesterase [Guyanagaster necrorhizus MCA 3950]